MRDLLAIHHLDKYWFADNIDLPVRYSIGNYIEKRVLEIDYSLYKYDIKEYVVVDDIEELNKFYPYNFVEAYNYLNEDNEKECIKILKRF